MRQLACAVLLLAACKDTGRGNGGGPLDLSGCVGIGCNVAACGDNDTTVVGTVFAPNGVDPVPNATVYVPSGAPAPFANTVSCDLCGIPPNAVTSTTTRYDGGFVLSHVPAGNNVPVVIELGRFRRVVTMNITACQPNIPPKDAPSFGVRLPGKNAELSPDDRIPKIAVATGDFDQIECVLKRMGIQQVDLYDDRYKGTLPATQGNLFTDLLEDRTKLETYNLVIINCTDAGFEPKLTPTVLGNLEHYVGAGGRVYATDWAYDFINQVPAFSPFLCFVPGGVDGPSPPATCTASPMTPGTAHSNTPWSTGAVPVDDTLTKWLSVFPGTLVSGQVPVSFNFVVINQVGPPADYPTKVWLEGVAAGTGLPQLSKGKRAMTVTFDYKQCGRVHYSTYNTEPNAAPPDDATTRYPSCGNRTTFNPQERLLEYLIFETAQCVGPIG